MFLAARLSVGPEILLSAPAPEDATGEFVILLPVTLIVHLLGAKMPARERKVLGCFRVFHGNSYAFTPAAARVARFTAARVS